MNKQVADLLFDEPAELTKLYGYLVTHMDYSTCVVGVKRRLSYQAMKELLEVSATKGRKRVPSSKEKARAFIKRMCVIGLIVDQGHCVYKLSYESPNNSDLRRFPQGSREVAEHLASDNSNLASKFPQDSRELPTHLYKKKKTTVDAFVMTDDWEPSEAFADMVLSGLGLDVTPEWQARLVAKTRSHGKQNVLPVRRMGDRTVRLSTDGIVD